VYDHRTKKNNFEENDSEEKVENIFPSKHGNNSPEEISQNKSQKSQRVVPTIITGLNNEEEEKEDHIGGFLSNQNGIQTSCWKRNTPIYSDESSNSLESSSSPSSLSLSPLSSSPSFSPSFSKFGTSPEQPSITSYQDKRLYRSGGCMISSPRDENHQTTSATTLTRSADYNSLEHVIKEL